VHQGVSGTIDAFNFIRRIGFPPTPEVVSAFITLTGFGAITSIPLSGLTLSSTVLVTGLVIVLPTVLGESLNSTIILRGDPVLNFRRLMGMEVIAWSSILLLLPASATLGEVLGNRVLWIGGMFIAATVSLPVRFLTIFAMSVASRIRKLVAAVIVPATVLCLYLATTGYLVRLQDGGFQGLILRTDWTIVPGLSAIIVGSVVAGLGVVRIIERVDRQGSPLIGDAPMGLFRDFLRHWLKGDTKPLENRLAVLGRSGRIEVSTLAFEGAGGKKSCMIISNFHPGPYRDLGSGGLPSMLKHGVEESNSSIVMVPHGISNHEYNIISHDDILRLVHDTGANYPSTMNQSGSSVLVRENSRDAKATAQVFGDTVLLTLTLAPIDMEDIPAQVKDAVDKAAQAKGLVAMIADAHNSLMNQISITADQADMLREAATKALDAVAQLPRSPFKVGAASNSLKEFKLEDGIGPGGVTVLTIECQRQRVAYVTIDGNNMQAGFRQTLLDSLRSEGIDDGEVMTTDTHLVAGLVRSRLGYHPVGEGVDKDLLVSRVKETLRAALLEMQEGSSGFATFDLDLRVLGSASFQGITSFVGRMAGDIGRSFVRLEFLVFLLSAVIMAVL
jgi:putative membrane protein